MIRVALLAALVILAGSSQLGRAGYSVDEEFTAFAVRGIKAHGLPLLPSGLLYDRGLAYSFASAVIDGRVVSLVSAAFIVLLTWELVRRHSNAHAGLLAATLVAMSVPFWATATTARFYAPFLALLVATLIAISRPPAGLGRFAIAAALAVLARLTHELAFLLVVPPLLCALVARDGRRRWLLAAGAVGFGLAVAQAVIFALHALDPPSGEAMVRRFFLWQVLNLFERPGDRQVGMPFVVLAIAVLVAPRRAFVWVVTSLSIAAAIAAYSIARASQTAPISAELVRTVLADGARYPLDMFWHIARTTPFTLLAALLSIALRYFGAGGEWRPAERAAHLAWIGWVLWFGIIESGITTNYLLLPISFMLMAIAVDVDAIIRRLRPRLRILPGALAALFVLGIALDQWRGEGGVLAKLAAHRPTIDIAGIDEIRASLQSEDRVACTDELGCMMLLGRIDMWLALHDYVRERFVVRRSPTEVTGVYTGVPAVFRPGELLRPNKEGFSPTRTIIVDIFKDYPIGNSKSWLPRAIEQDGLLVTPLLETPQARVLQISPAERLAVMQPFR